jgi:hypothetical protein
MKRCVIRISSSQWHRFATFGFIVYIVCSDAEGRSSWRDFCGKRSVEYTMMVPVHPFRFSGRGMVTMNIQGKKIVKSRSMSTHNFPSDFSAQTGTSTSLFFIQS